MAPIENVAELILAQTVAVLEEVGHTQAVELLLDAQLVIEAGSSGWGGATTYDAKIDVGIQLISRFTTEVHETIVPVMKSIAGRHLSGGISSWWDDENDVERCFTLRALPPPVDKDWRTTIAQRLNGAAPSNQARKERGDAANPSEDGLVFASLEELQVYRRLKEIQEASRAEQTFSIIPLPGVYQRSGLTVTPDFLVVGFGKAVVIEVDGPHHKKRGRYGADVSRDRSWNRCSVRVLRVLVEDVADEAGLRERLREDLRRELWQKP